MPSLADQKPQANRNEAEATAEAVISLADQKPQANRNGLGEAVAGAGSLADQKPQANRNPALRWVMLVIKPSRSETAGQPQRKAGSGPSRR